MPQERKQFFALHISKTGQNDVRGTITSKNS